VRTKWTRKKSRRSIDKKQPMTGEKTHDHEVGFQILALARVNGVGEDGIKKRAEVRQEKEKTDEQERLRLPDHGMTVAFDHCLQSIRVGRTTVGKKE